MAHRYLKLFPDDLPNRRTFPTPVEPDDDSTEWKLRYAPQSLSREDQMYAASVLSAYGYLILEMTAKDRNSVVSEIRRQLSVSDRPEDRSMAEKQTFAAATTHTVTLPNPHLVAPGTRFTIDTGEWQCVHEGDHAFWETWKQPITITVQVPNPDADNLT